MNINTEHFILKSKCSKSRQDNAINIFVMAVSFGSQKLPSMNVLFKPVIVSGMHREWLFIRFATPGEETVSKDQKKEMKTMASRSL